MVACNGLLVGLLLLGWEWAAHMAATNMVIVPLAKALSCSEGNMLQNS